MPLVRHTKVEQRLQSSWFKIKTFQIKTFLKALNPKTGESDRKMLNYIWAAIFKSFHFKIRYGNVRVTSICCYCWRYHEIVRHLFIFIYLDDFICLVDRWTSTKNDNKIDNCNLKLILCRRDTSYFRIGMYFECSENLVNV